MNELISTTSPAMTSREIAELTGKQHKHVLRDIDGLVKTLSPELGLGFKSSAYKDATGKENRMYLMDRDSSICLVSGYDANARMRIIKRWQELEAAKPAELTREQILVMALESERERLRLAAELEAAQPMIQFHDEIAQGGGEFTIRETVKALFNRAITEQQLSGWLRQQGWLCQSSREPTAWAMDRGMMRLRTEYLPACGKTILVPVLTGHGFTLLRHLYRTGELFTAGISADRLLPPPSQAM